MPVGEFETDNPICEECWEKWVQAQCTGEIGDFDRCEDYYEGCVKCRQDYCREGAENGWCDLETVE